MPADGEPGRGQPEADVLGGASGSDWFFADLVGGVALDSVDASAGSEAVDELGVPSP